MQQGPRQPCIPLLSLTPWHMLLAWCLQLGRQAGRGMAASAQGVHQADASMSMHGQLLYLPHCAAGLFCVSFPVSLPANPTTCGYIVQPCCNQACYNRINPKILRGLASGKTQCPHSNSAHSEEEVLAG